MDIAKIIEKIQDYEAYGIISNDEYALVLQQDKEDVAQVIIRQKSDNIEAIISGPKKYWTFLENQAIALGTNTQQAVCC